MSEVRAHVVLLVDWATLKPADGKAAKPARRKSGEDESPAAAPQSPLRALVALSQKLGRLAVARAYHDWTKDAAGSQEVQSARLEPILVPDTDDGRSRGAMCLAVEALESLYVGDEPDAFVLATSDSTLLPLLQALKADGSEVYVVAPEASAPADLREEADRFLSLEETIAGVEVEAIKPRAWRSARADVTDDAPRVKGGGGGAGHVRPDEAQARRAPHPTPVRTDEDFATYDWGPFVKLIDELERRLPFVGVRYLVNKVLGFHNCGIDDPRLKRELMNRAVDDGVIEMYPVGNVGDRSDPVTACRLDRRNATVVAVLGQTSTPQPPAEDRPEDEPAHAAHPDDELD